MLTTPLRYGTPGVYVEWLDPNAQRLEVGRTDVAGFIGIAERGPLHRASKIESMRQFVTTFGAHGERGFLAYAVEGFFANGGRTCWVVRVAHPREATRARIGIELSDKRRVVFEAATRGEWGNRVRIDPVWGRDEIIALTATEEGRPSQLIMLGPGTPPLRLATTSVLDRKDCAQPELTQEHLVRQNPDVVVADYLPIAMTGGTCLAGGADGLSGLTLDHFAGDPQGKGLWGIDALSRVDDVSIVAAPDLHFPEETPAPGVSQFGATEIRDAQNTILARCIELRDRVFLVDPPRVDRNAAMNYVAPPAKSESFVLKTSFAAVYHPWIVVDDPLKLHGNVRFIPPSGHVAGMFARTTRLRGVHKPPANEVLEGVWDLFESLDDEAHASLNDANINAIRVVPGRGVRVLGARTLDKDALWRYVSVRRLLAMIEEALDEQLQWLTFEPNNPRLWREIERVVRGFLERLFRAGMLDGATSDDAYFVRCDATTNPSEDTDAGRVLCELGLQPPWPAEFVVVRIGVTRSGIQIEEKGAQDG